jgi:4'-phosphopantetheinyl transferase
VGEHAGAGAGPLTVWLQRGHGDARAQARRVLTSVAAESLGVPLADLHLTVEPGGRPVLAVDGARDAPHVAMSHCGGAVAVVVSRQGPVGVDVERLRSLPALALARRWLAATEADWLAGIPTEAQVAAFLLLWTQKEAVGKALGIGLRNGGMSRRIPVPVLDGSRRMRQVPGLDSMAVAACAVEPDLVLALACQAAEGQDFAVHELAPVAAQSPDRALS